MSIRKFRLASGISKVTSLNYLQLLKKEINGSTIPSTATVAAAAAAISEFKRNHDGDAEDYVD